MTPNDLYNSHTLHFYLQVIFSFVKYFGTLFVTFFLITYIFRRVGEGGYLLLGNLSNLMFVEFRVPRDFKRAKMSSL